MNRPIAFFRKYFLIILIFILFSFINNFHPKFIKLLDLKWWDFLQKVFPEQYSNEVVVIEIDDAALVKFGRWPFSRTVLAEFIDKLSSHDPSVIALDIVFAETSEDDETFSSSVFYAGNVVGSVFLDERVGLTKNLDELDYFPEIDIFPKTTRKSFIGNVSSISGSFLGRGHVSIGSDFDGIVRHFHPIFNYDDHAVLGMAFISYLLHKGIDFQDLSVREDKMFAGDRIIPLTNTGAMFIHYLKEIGSIPYVTMNDIWDDNVDMDLSGKILVVGLTSTGLHDYRPTPISPSMPGVEIEATIVNNLITGNIIRPHGFYSNLFAFMIMIFLGLVFVMVNYKFNYPKAIISVILLFALLIGVHFTVFRTFKMILNFAIPSIFFIILFAYFLSYYYLVSSKGARELKMILSHYLSPNVMNVLVKNPDQVKLGGKKVKIAVMFGDVTGFTSFSESHPPEEVVSYLNKILTVLTNEVFKYNGTLDKYMGDCIMAFWGAPLPDENSCENCVLSAIEMIDQMKKFNLETKEKFYIGTGINYGDAVAGNMGSDTLYDYTVMGDAVNTASRVEGVTRLLNNALVITEAVYVNLPEYLQMRFEKNPEMVQVKGKAEGLVVYKLIGYPLKDV